MSKDSFEHVRTLCFAEDVKEMAIECIVHFPYYLLVETMQSSSSIDLVLNKVQS
jgi:hypothetical protein